MIKLNRMTDYGAVVMSLLAFQYRYDQNQSLSVSEVAIKTGLTSASISKILKILAASGLVASTRGKHGGYCLNQPPEDISVAAIIEALEGPIALTACVETSVEPCNAKQSCFLSGHWERVNSVIDDALRAMSLADLINPDHYFNHDALVASSQPESQFESQSELKSELTR